MDTPRFEVFVTDHGFKSLDPERAIIEAAGGTLTPAQCRSEEEVIAGARHADAVLVQWAPITARVLEALDRCRVIVRYGVGVDNIDVPAATRRGIPVCNVPDYCTNEVADHTMALALALVRQLPALERRLRAQVWKIVPDQPMPACRDMLFASAGFGRTGRAVLQRAKGFNFRLGAYDPLVSADDMRAAGVTPLAFDELFAEADVLTLHLPSTPETRHIINRERLASMRRTAVLVNTARGDLIDTEALAEALAAGTIAAAGLDVFEREPPPPDHPLFRCDNAVLTSHVAWFSEQSLPTLQRLAAQEAVRGVLGQPLRHRLNAEAAINQTEIA